MATIYLDLNSGNDSNDGLTIGNPKLTLNNAVTAAGTGGTVILLDGTYTLSTSVSTIINTNITFRSQSNDPSLCIIDGGAINRYYYQMYTNLNATQFIMHGIGFKNMNISNYGLYVVQANNTVTTVYNCRFYYCVPTGTNKSTLGCPNGTFSNISFTIHTCAFIGYDGLNNIVFNEGWIGSGSNVDYFDVNTYNCVFIVYSTDNAPYCIFTKKSTCTITTRNCIFYSDNANTTTTSYNATGTATFSYNDSYANDVGSVEVYGTHTQEGNITSDPLFVDLDNFNYHLRPNSPCIDTGTLL